MPAEESKSPVSVQPTRDRQVRVFISSTFRDMHAVRDHLVTAVFPELRERVREPRHFRNTADQQRQQQEPRSVTYLLTTHIGPHEGANHDR